MAFTHAQQLITILQKKGVQFETGLTDNEVFKIESLFNITFPPDLRLFLKEALPVSKEFINWRQGLSSESVAAKIISCINWPLEGMLFDIENNVYWPELWGEKPGSYEEQVTIATKHYQTYPTLVPIYSHRYIPAYPNEAGNPIFSVYQMDIIYYGYNLATYFAHEFHFVLPENFECPKQPKLIEFWSDCVE